MAENAFCKRAAKVRKMSVKNFTGNAKIALYTPYNLKFQTIKNPSGRRVFVRVIGLEPTCLTASDPKSDTSANFATPAGVLNA